jgi:hypothetical protein
VRSLGGVLMSEVPCTSDRDFCFWSRPCSRAREIERERERERDKERARERERVKECVCERE